MMQKFTLAAYWDARADNVEKCTEDTAQLFARLAEIDPLLAHWYERGRSRKDALERKVDILNAQKLQDLLLKGRNRRDIDKTVIEDLGFSLGLWNGASREEEEASVSIHCGCYSKWVGNNVLVHLPYQSEGPQWVENASSLLAMVAEIWRPTWAGIMSRKAMRERDFDVDHPLVDWMVYVPRTVESVPLPGRVEVLNGLGSIVVVQPDPPVGDEAELSHIRQIESLLAA